MRCGARCALEAVATQEPWRERPRVLAAVVLNPKVPRALALRLVESLALELRHQGIQVNCVLPGTIDTPQNRQSMPKADHSRWVPPEAIADVVLFLASDAARAVNGAAVPVYGRS